MKCVILVQMSYLRLATQFQPKKEQAENPGTRLSYEISYMVSYQISLYTTHMWYHRVMSDIQFEIWDQILPNQYLWTLTCSNYSFSNLWSYHYITCDMTLSSWCHIWYHTGSGARVLTAMGAYMDLDRQIRDISAPIIVLLLYRFVISCLQLYLHKDSLQI